MDLSVIKMKTSFIIIIFDGNSVRNAQHMPCILEVTPFSGYSNMSQ